MTVFGFVFKLCSLRVNTLYQGVQTSRNKTQGIRGCPYSPSARIGTQGRGPKLELCFGGGFQKWSTEVRGRRDKGIQKWSRRFRHILVLVFNTFPRPFSAKTVINLTGKVENALRSKSKSTAVHQKETKFNEKSRSASAIISRRRCIDHPQKWKVLYLSID